MMVVGILGLALIVMSLGRLGIMQSVEPVLENAIKTLLKQYLLMFRLQQFWSRGLLETFQFLRI